MIKIPVCSSITQNIDGYLSRNLTWSILRIDYGKKLPVITTVRGARMCLYNCVVKLQIIQGPVALWQICMSANEPATHCADVSGSGLMMFTINRLRN